MKLLQRIPRWPVWFVVGLLVPVALTSLGFGSRSFLADWVLTRTRVAVPPETYNARASARRGQLSRLNALADRAQRLAAVEELTPRVAEDRDGIYLYPSQEYPWIEAETERLVRDFKQTRVTDEDVRVGVFVVPRDFGVPEDLETTRGRPWDAMVVETDSGPQCLRVTRNTPDLRPPDTPRSHRYPVPATSAALEARLGVCAWVARYGVPGDRIWDWMVAQRLVAATTEFDPGAIRDGPISFFGGTRTSLDSRACAAGTLERCATYWASAEADDFDAWGARVAADRDLGLVARELVYRRSSFRAPELARGGLHALERELGPDAFEAFWTSDAEPAEAFRAASGMDPNEWMRNQARYAGVPVSAGPLPGGWSLFALLSTSALALLVGARTAARRTIG